MKKIMFTFVALFVFIVSLSFTAMAAELNAVLAPSVSSARENDTVKVNLNITNTTSVEGVACLDSTINYDPEVLEYVSVTPDGSVMGMASNVPDAGKILVNYADTGGGANAFKKNGTFLTITFKVKKGAPLGETTVSGSLSNIADSNMDDHTATLASAKINILEPLSDNAFLSELKISDGNLSPAFNKSTINYAVSVPCSVDKLGVTAKAEDANAKVAIGNTSLKAGGVTKITITVTAENPDIKKVYTLNVTRASNPNPPTSSQPVTSSRPSSSEAPSSTVEESSDVSYEFESDPYESDEKSSEDVGGPSGSGGAKAAIIWIMGIVLALGAGFAGGVFWERKMGYDDIP